MGDGLTVALHQYVEVGEIVSDAPGQAVAERRLEQRLDLRSGMPAEAVAVDAVDDQLAAGHVPGGESLGEEQRLARRLRLGRGDDQEGCGWLAQKRGDAAGALAKALDHSRYRAEEHREIREHVHAGDA